MIKVSIVIPVYKEQMSVDERLSFVQCLKILKNYPVTIVTHFQLNTKIYSDLALKYNKFIDFEYFNKEYFDSIQAYNRLLYSRDFYARFVQNEYILIYQLDGFVFRDELDDWCKKGFDYIGAPWLIHYGRGKYENSHQLYKVGNGGVSLRRISAFLERFDKRMPLSVFPFYVKNIRKKRMKIMIIKTIKLLFLLILSQKTVEYCLQYLTEDVIPEDCFWADALSNTKLAFKTPDVITGAHFCFEKASTYLYQMINNQLPFACHAYKKYEYESFWRKFITE